MTFIHISTGIMASLSSSPLSSPTEKLYEVLLGFSEKEKETKKDRHDNDNDDRIVMDWDDGFVPSGCNNRRGKMITFLDNDGSACTTSGKSSGVTVIDDALSAQTADAIYTNAITSTNTNDEGNSSSNNNSNKVWGEYIKLDDVDDILKRNTSENNDPTTSTTSERQHQHHYRTYLAAKAVKELFLTPNSGFYNKIDDELQATNRTYRNIHGISVWMICSSINDTVQYHIDYAEMFRYQTNIIYPPMYGSTLQVSPVVASNAVVSNNNDTSTRTTTPTNKHHHTMKMNGGNFYVNTNGLDHYSKHKYKCSLDTLDLDLQQMEATNTNADGDTDEYDDDALAGIKNEEEKNVDQVHRNTSTNNGWRKVQYKYNRATLCDGTLPHFSSPVTSIESTESSISSSSRRHKRVIVGFNICNCEIGPLVEQYPEHSSKFNNYVKIYQATNKFKDITTTTSSSSSSSTNDNGRNKKRSRGGGGFTIEDAKRNPRVASFIKLLAKKYKENMMANATSNSNSNGNENGNTNNSQEETVLDAKNTKEEGETSNTVQHGMG